MRASMTTSVNERSRVKKGDAPLDICLVSVHTIPLNILKIRQHTTTLARRQVCWLSPSEHDFVYAGLKTELCFTPCIFHNLTDHTPKQVNSTIKSDYVCRAHGLQV